ncbi:MAG: hypothetical protein PHQ23_04025 [Candidatus Wallbacteria bacterium]|nr:hypothetical protein [Candidatus Wallbacteria bacterium]
MSIRTKKKTRFAFINMTIGFSPHFLIHHPSFVFILHSCKMYSAMNKLLTLAILALSLQLGARESLLYHNYEDHFTFSLSFLNYHPDEARTLDGTQISGLLTTGSFGFFTTSRCRMEMSYGRFDENCEGHKAEVNPFLLEWTFYQNLSHNWKYHYGCGIGSFRFAFQPMPAGPMYSHTDMGFSIKTGLTYLISENFFMSLDGEFLGAECYDLIPPGIVLPPQLHSRNLKISDTTFGISMNFAWK